MTVSRAPLVGAFLSLGFVSAAIGQTRIAVDPPRVELLARAGSQVNDAIRVVNRSPNAVRVTVSLTDFELDSGGAVVEMPPASHPSSIAPIVRISPVETIVAPDESVFFRYTISTPNQFEQKRGYVYFRAVPLAKSGQEARQVLFAVNMGVPIYIENPASRPGEVRVDGFNWSRDPKRPGEIVLRTTLTNVGDRNHRPGGFIRVRSRDGSFADTWNFNQGSEVVLPGSTRVIENRFGPAPDRFLEMEARILTSARRRQSFDLTLEANPAKKSGK